MDDTIPPPDTSRANAARVYDYWLGGKDNYAADRLAAEQIADLYPPIRVAAVENRMFHQRAARWMARRGIRQFLDIGCGLPTMESTHEAVRKVAPDARVVYADSDPVVVCHAAALLADKQDGVTAIRADAREPEVILRTPAVRDLLHPGEPAGLLMTAVLHFIAGAYDPWEIVGRYMAGLAPGSCIAISHGTADNINRDAAAEGERVYAASQHPIHLRTRAQVRALFRSLELVPPWQGAKPDAVAPRDWTGPDVPRPRGKDPWLPGYGAVLWCGVGRKPR